MTAIPDYTLVICLDKRTAQFFAHSFEVWRRYQPHLLDQPWLIVFDQSQLNPDVVRSICGYVAGFRNTDVRAIPWGAPGVDYENQREKMLTAFVQVPPDEVKTEYWLKIDVDAVPNDRDPWINPEWFDGKPDLIGSKWHYTKPKNQMATLDDWGDTVTGLKDYPRLDLPVNPESNKCKHPRIASWICFQKTEWHRKVVQYIRETHGLYKMPVPSHDGLLWYLAERCGDDIRRVNFKRTGWSNHSSIRGLKNRVDELLGNSNAELV